MVKPCKFCVKRVIIDCNILNMDWICHLRKIYDPALYISEDRWKFTGLSRPRDRFIDIIITVFLIYGRDHAREQIFFKEGDLI